MKTPRFIAATFAALALSGSLLLIPIFAQGIKTAMPERIVSSNPLAYIQSGTSAKGDFTRTLSLFKDGRVVLVTLFTFKDTSVQPATVQTGTWKRGSSPDRFSISLTRQNEKPYRETILMTGTPGNEKELSAIGDGATQYGAYGLTFAPRIANNVATSYDDKYHRITVTATGIKPTVLEQVFHAQITGDGYDVLYWKNGGGGGFENEGESLYYFNTLTGKSRRITAFPTPIQKVRETRLASGRPVLIVSYASGETGMTGVALVDPLRERTVKHWLSARLTDVTPGKITIANYRAQDITRANAKPVNTKTVVLDDLFRF